MSRMSKFFFGVADSVFKECRTIMLIKEMDLSSLMVHAQKIKEQKFKEKEGENKRARIGSFIFAWLRSEGGNLTQFH